MLLKRYAFDPSAKASAPAAAPPCEQQGEIRQCHVIGLREEQAHGAQTFDSVSATMGGAPTHRVWLVPCSLFQPFVCHDIGLEPDASFTLYVPISYDDTITECGIVNGEYTAKKQGLWMEHDDWAGIR
jgi:hypothetical protein